MAEDELRVAQLQLPDPADADPYPQMLLEGRGIHAGEGFTALFPDGWHDIALEVSWELTGPGCWFISTPVLGISARLVCLSEYENDTADSR